MMVWSADIGGVIWQGEIVRRNQKGFSLIELVIVVAIILLFAAIAVPNLLRSRIAANEALAVGSVRAINTSARTYYSTYHNGYPAGLVAMGTSTADTTPSCGEALLIDSQLTLGTKTGYNFTYSDGSGDTPNSATLGGCAGWNAYTVNADPVTPGTSGQRHFYSDQTGVIRYNANGVAGTTDAPVQ
jgi:prepilin-type N-terminal cleavage/methylation domain-containing protein